MKKKSIEHLVWPALFLALLVSSSVVATPTFQVYVEGGSAGDVGSDTETWFTSENPFNVVVVGAYGAKTVNLTQVTLALSVPIGETGTIIITGGDGVNLLTSTALVAGTTYYNPNADADIALLNDVSGNTGYTDKSFLPDDHKVESNHYPFQADVSNFLIYAIRDFDELGTVHNYNADGGTITEEGSGEEKVFSVSVTGFSRVHFDAYGYDVKEDGESELVGSWDANPGSHDSTYTKTEIPAPGAVLLGSIGTILVGWVRRRRESLGS